VVVNNQAEYRKIIVSYNANAVIDDSIGGALAQLFPRFDLNIGDRAGAPVTDPGTDPTAPPVGSETADELLLQAQTLFDEADAALRADPIDFATYADKQSQARALIEQALELLQSTSTTAPTDTTGSTSDTTGSTSDTTATTDGGSTSDTSSTSGTTETTGG
jgi:hypothetical protein